MSYLTWVLGVSFAVMFSVVIGAWCEARFASTG